jgi:minor fimbrial subunit
MSTGLLKGTGSGITQNIGADGTATIPMLASVKSVSGGATPGSIHAVVMITLQYN